MENVALTLYVSMYVLPVICMSYFIIVWRYSSDCSVNMVESRRNATKCCRSVATVVAVSKMLQNVADLLRLWLQSLAATACCVIVQ